MGHVMGLRPLYFCKSFIAEIDFESQILTSKVCPRAERVTMYRNKDILRLIVICETLVFCKNGIFLFTSQGKWSKVKLLMYFWLFI